MWLVACAGDDGGTVVIDLASALDGDRAAEVTRSFDGDRTVTIVVGAAPVVVEAWAAGGTIEAAAPPAVDGSPSWLVPVPASGEITLEIVAAGTAELTVWGRGAPAPAVDRDRALTWLDNALLDDPSVISFARVLAAIAPDRHGGVLLDRWFRAFAAGPGAGRAAFAQFVDEVAAAQGADPATWDLGALPFKVTGVHARHDLARGVDCGELRVSIASTHPTFSPVHLIFLFHQPPSADDVTPDGVVHCRGAARRWARLGALDDTAWRAAAREILDESITAEHFAMAESVELTISPWQWRQWTPDAAAGFINPALFQTVDAARMNTFGLVRDQFLADVMQDANAIAEQRWEIPARYRSAVAEVQPNIQAPLVDLSPLVTTLAAFPELPRTLGMNGCPRCHTDNADFIQTSVDRVPSPFYDRELDTRAARLDALNRGESPASPPFGPLQPIRSP